MCRSGRTIEFLRSAHSRLDSGLSVRGARDSLSTGAASIRFSKINSELKVPLALGRGRVLHRYAVHSRLFSELHWGDGESMKCCHFAVEVTAKSAENPRLYWVGMGEGLVVGK